MAYSKGITVQYRRDINIGVVDDEIPNSSYLSDFNLSSVNKIVSQLKELVKSDGGGFIWGQDCIMIDSTPEISYCENDLDKEVLPDIPTISLLNLMIEIQKLKTEFQNPNKLKKIIREAFAIVKLYPDNYRRWEESDTCFAVSIDNIYITLVLLPEDFNLTTEEYVNQLETTFH